MASAHAVLRRLAKLSWPARQGAAFSSAASTASPIVPRAESFSQWYNSTVSAADLTDHSPVRGCAILRPNGFALWEAIQRELDVRIKASGATNAYFPLLIPTSFLSREADHVEGFAKECAVVTHHRLRARAEKDGGGVEVDPTAKLAEPYVIRPTSETVIWDAFSRWIQSHRDLPLLINQWANVVRWEMRTRPFLRTSEFLWQEGHTAHATPTEARQYAERILALYSEFLTNVLAIPHVTGVKSPSERFAGADDTYTCEAMMGNGWALQAATSHYLGQHFSKAFNVHFMDANGVRTQPWATSWGASTRLIGGTIMAHGDDAGLVLPPAVAPIQVVIVPIAPSAKAAAKDDSTASAADVMTGIMSASKALADSLKAGGVRVVLDDDVGTAAGARYYKWERKGVPLRIEVGMRDIQGGKTTMKPRVAVTGHDFNLALGTGCSPIAAVATVSTALAAIQDSLKSSGLRNMQANLHRCSSFGELAEHAAAADRACRVDHEAGDEAEDGHMGATVQQSTAAPTATAATAGKAGKSKAPAAPYTPPYKLFLAPWADNAANEAEVKKLTKFTLRCYPSGGPALGTEAPELQAQAKGQKCFFSGQPATHMALFARAY